MKGKKADCYCNTSDPGLLTSKDLMMIKWGSEVKSLNGIGIFFSMYSQTTSMLYFSWAEIGMTGAPSATVPSMNRRIWEGKVQNLE